MNEEIYKTQKETIDKRNHHNSLLLDSADEQVRYYYSKTKTRKRIWHNLAANGKATLAIPVGSRSLDLANVKSKDIEELPAIQKIRKELIGEDISVKATMSYHDLREAEHRSQLFSGMAGCLGTIFGLVGSMFVMPSEPAIVLGGLGVGLATGLGAYALSKKVRPVGNVNLHFEQATTNKDIVTPPANDLGQPKTELTKAPALG